MPCSRTAVRPLPGASAAPALAIAWARPTNLAGSSGKYAIRCSAGSIKGLPRGTGSVSPAALGEPNTPGVTSETAGRASVGAGPAASVTARATAASIV
jgi:hypothetical protein